MSAPQAGALAPAKPKPEIVDLTALKDWPGAVRDLSKSVELFPGRITYELGATKAAYQAGLLSGVVLGLVVGLVLFWLADRLLPRDKR